MRYSRELDTGNDTEGWDQSIGEGPGCRIQLIIIDALTLGVAPDRQEDAFACEYASWKSILSYIMEIVEFGVEKSLKKGQVPDATMSRVVRHIVNKATSKRRTSYVNVLEPCADILMEHLSKDIIAFGIKIASKASAALDDNAAGSFVAKDLTMVRTVLQHMKYDIDAVLMESLCKIFRAFGDGVDLHSWTPRIVNEVVGLCVCCMVDSCGDYASEFQHVCRRFHHACMLLIRGGNLDGREVGMQYFFAAMSLDLLEQDQIMDLLEWYQRCDLEASWQKSPESNEYMFNSYQSLLVSLLSEIEIAVYRNKVHISGDGVKSGEQGWLRGTNRYGSLIADTVAYPTTLGPIACEFILRHGMYVEKEDLVEFCSKACIATESMLQHSFVAGSVKPEVVWMMRLVYALAAVAVQRDDIGSMDCRTLGSLVSLMIQQYNVLSSYPITKDLVKIIIITSLPKFHEIIAFLDPETFEKELVSEAPSALSLTLFDCMVRHKRFSSHSLAENKVFIDWICESLMLCVPSAAIASSLCVVLYGGVPDGDNIAGNEGCTYGETCIWWNKDSIHKSIEALPPVQPWSLFSIRDANAVVKSARHRAYNIRSILDLNIYLASNLTQKFKDALETKHIPRIFNTTTTGIRLLWHVGKIAGNYTCWKGLSEYFELLNKCMSECMGIIDVWIRSNSSLQEEQVTNMLTFAERLSGLASEKYCEYHEGIKTCLSVLPSLHTALNCSMRIPEFQDIALDSQPVGGTTSVLEARNSSNLSILTKKSGSATKAAPMIHWYLQACEYFCAWHPVESLQNTRTFVEYFILNNLYMPLAVRAYSASLEAQCVAHLLRQSPLDAAEHILQLQFSQVENGTYTYDQDDSSLLLKPEIFQTVLNISHELVQRTYQNILGHGEKQYALVCMESLANTIVSLAFRLTGEEYSTSNQRIYCARMVIDLFEISRQLESNLIPESMFDSIVEWLASSVLDPRFCVRICVSNLFPNLLDIFDDPSNLFHSVLELVPIQCNEDGETAIRVESDKDAIIKTVVLTLGKVALKVDKLELVCVTTLLQELSTENVAINDTVLKTLGWVGKSLGYDSGQSYFKAMSREIAVHLLSSARKLVPNVEKFILACALLGLEDIPGKLVIFAILVFFRSTNGIKGLLHVLKESSPELLIEESMADIYAIHYHLSESADAESLVKSIEQNLRKILNSFGLTAMNTEIIARAASSDILVHVIGTAGVDFQEEDSRLTENRSVILQVVKCLSDDSSYGTQVRPIDTMDLLVRIKEKLHTFRHPRHKSLAMRATKCTILSIKDSLNNPAILRQTLSIIANLIRVKSTAEQASELLKYIVTLTMDLEGSHGSDHAALIDTIGHEVAPLLSNLCDAYEKFKYATDSKLLQAIKVLTCNQELQDFIAKRADTSSLDAQICTFAEISQHLSSSTRSAYIKMLQGLLGEYSVQKGRIVTEATLWKLVMAAASEEGDEKLTDFAGELVSYFGPLEPHVVTLKPKQNHSLQNISQQARRQYSKEVLEEEVYYRAIILLSDFLIDEDSVVCSEAFRILQVLLSTQVGNSVFNSLDPLTQDYLSIFLQCELDTETSQNEVMIPESLYSKEIWSLDGVGYEDWVTRVGSKVLSISQNHVLRTCKKLASIQARFCEILLPLAFADLATSKAVESKAPNMSKMIGKCISQYVFPFSKPCPSVMNVLLSIFHSLRIFIHQQEAHSADAERIPYKWKTICWIEMDYLDICEACIHARSLYSALIFAERWEQEYGKDASEDAIRRSQKLLLEIYTLLPEPDGLYAVSRYNNALSQLRKFEREGDWSKALVVSDVALQLLDENNVSGAFMDISRQEASASIRRCLNNLGASHLISAISSKTYGQAVRMEPQITQSARKPSQWEAIHHLASAARETTADLNPLIVKLQMAQGLAETWDLRWNENVLNPALSNTHARLEEQIQGLNELWKSREHIAGKGWRFSLEIPLKDLRYEILKLLNHGELQAECLLDIAICARKSNRNGQAFGALSRFRQFLNLTRENWRNKYTPVESAWRLEEVKTLWAQNQLDAALWTLYALSRNAKRTETNSAQVSYMNALLFKWMAITQRESSSQILDALEQNSNELLKLSSLQPETSSQACRVHYRMASYADHLYKEICAKKASADWERSRSIMDRKEKQKQELEAEFQAERNNPSKRQRKSNAPSTMRLQSSIKKLQTTIQEDQQVFASADENEIQCERLAMKGYCLALQYGDHYDLPAMFRLVDIWLSQSSETLRSKQVNICFSERAGGIPSHKLIPLSHQLASRLADGAIDGADCSNFQRNLQSMLFRMTKDHPFHMLPILFALKNGDRTTDNYTSRSQSGGWVFEANESRIKAARYLIQRIKSLTNVSSQ
eukprot:jgi/Picre1/31798/NNA_007147.t1